MYAIRSYYAAAGSDHAQFLAEPEVLGSVDGHHLDRRDGIHALPDGMAQDAVHVSFAGDRLCV